MDISQAFLTGGVGAALTLGGWIGLKFFAEPILEQWRLRARIANALTFYANAFAARGLASDAVVDEMKDASTALRTLAAELRASRHTVRCYRRLEKLGLVLPRAVVHGAAAELIGWANNLYDDPTSQPGVRFERRMRIAELLRLDHGIDVSGSTRDSRVLSGTRSEEPVKKVA